MTHDMSIDLSMPGVGNEDHHNNSGELSFHQPPPVMAVPHPHQQHHQQHHNAPYHPSNHNHNHNYSHNHSNARSATYAQPQRTEQQLEHVHSEQLSVLQKQGFPIGLANELNSSKTFYPIRFWVVDNSGSMLTPDGHELRGSGETVMVCPCTRWAELRSSVLYHAELAALLEATTIFRFLNDPGVRAGPQEFSISENPDTSVAQDLSVARSVVEKTVPKGVTPLTDHLQEIRMRIEAMEPALNQCGQSVAIVLATDGLPSDVYGDSTELVQQEFIMSLKALQSLPVWIVVRLCTDDENVVNYYNDLDSSLELPLEVIDDFLGEAQEIQRANAWLNYTMPLHRCREMGYHHRIFDLLDERLLNKDELREFLELLFGKALLIDFPDIHMDWRGFVQHLSKFVAEAGKHYNPLARKPTPWIDMKQLEKCYKGGGGARGGGAGAGAAPKKGRLRLFQRNKKS